MATATMPFLRSRLNWSACCSRRRVSLKNSAEQFFLLWCLRRYAEHGARPESWQRSDADVTEPRTVHWNSRPQRALFRSGCPAPAARVGAPCRPVRTPLVTTGLGFYNPPNTAKKTVPVFIRALGTQPPYRTAVCSVSKSLVFTPFSVFPRSTE